MALNGIDWDATGSMLQGIGGVIGSVAVIGAAIIGSRTFDGWKKQRLEEMKIEEAKKILTATYKVRRGLSRVRSPAMWGHETDVAEEQLKQSGEWEKTFPESERGKLAILKAYYNRIDATKEDRMALEECQPLARAFFGENVEAAIETLNKQFWTVKIYADANFRDRRGVDADFRRKIDSAIWEGFPSTEENEIDKIISENVKIIEDSLVRILRSSSLIESYSNLN